MSAQESEAGSKPCFLSVAKTIHLQCPSRSMMCVNGALKPVSSAPPPCISPTHDQSALPAPAFGIFKNGKRNVKALPPACQSTDTEDKTKDSTSTTGMNVASPG